MNLPDVPRHEAGHAVAAWYFGYPIDFVSIEPAQDFARRCIASPLLKEGAASEAVVKPDEYVRVLQAIDVCLAGHEAEAVFTGRRPRAVAGAIASSPSASLHIFVGTLRRPPPCSAGVGSARTLSWSTTRKRSTLSPERCSSADGSRATTSGWRSTARYRGDHHLTI
jgi:hypothetical protein